MNYDHGIMTMVMQTVSKSQFKSQVLQYLRNVEEKKQPLIVTHGGKPVVKVSPFQEDPKAILNSLKGSITSYKNPDQPTGENEWEVLK